METASSKQEPVNSTPSIILEASLVKILNELVKNEASIELMLNKDSGLRGAKVCDPVKGTRLFQLGTEGILSAVITFKGEWSLGRDKSKFPYVGPLGYSPDKHIPFNDFNKGCAGIAVFDPRQRFVAYPWVGKPILVVTQGFPTTILAFCNDEKIFDDNSNNPSNPMTAYWSF